MLGSLGVEEVNWAPVCDHCGWIQQEVNSSGTAAIMAETAVSAGECGE